MKVRLTIILIMLCGLYSLWQKEIHSTIHCVSIHQYNNQHNLLWSEH